MKRAVIVVAVAALVAVAAGFVAVEFFAAPLIRGAIVRIANQYFGYEVEIEGDARLGLFPSPSILLGSMSLKSPRGQMVHAEEIGISLDLGELFESRRIWPERILLRNTRIDVPEAIHAGIEDSFADKKGTSYNAIGDVLAREGIDVTELPVIDLHELEVRWGVGQPDATSWRLKRFRFEPGEPSRLELELEVDGVPVDLASRIQRRADGGLAFESARIDSPANDLEGEIIWYPQGKRHRVVAKLRSKHISLTDDESSEEQPETPLLDRTVDPRTIPDLDVEIDLKAERATIGDLDLEQLRTHIAHLGEEIRWRIDESRLWGGSLEAEMLARSRSSPTPVQFTLRIADVEIADLPDARFVGLGGRASVEMKIDSRGTSLHELLATATGAIGVRLEGVVAPSASVDRLGRNPIGLAMTFINPQVATELQCSIFYAQLVDGAGQSTFVAETADMVMIARGRIDLRDFSYDGIMRPHPKRASIGSFRTPYRVRGPLADLKVTPDTREMGIDTARILSQGLTRPVTIVSPFFDPGREDVPCGTLVDDEKKTTGVDLVPRTVKGILEKGVDQISTPIRPRGE